ncbi:hypothetical protein L9F63_022683, partial [Diploptera punctata]
RSSLSVFSLAVGLSPNSYEFFIRVLASLWPRVFPLTRMSCSSVVTIVTMASHHGLSPIPVTMDMGLSPNSDELFIRVLVSPCHVTITRHHSRG